MGKVRDQLLLSGFILGPWSSPIPAPEGEVMETFERGTLEGLFSLSERRLGVVAIVNKIPGNGQFLSMMDDLKRISAQTGAELRFYGMMNPALAKHLRKKHGFKAKGNDMVMQISESNVLT